MCVISAVAAHRAQVSADFRRKLGPEVYETIEALNHNPYEDLVYLGHTSGGTPVHVNREVVEADIRIGVGGIVPHPAAGFGGGGKLILPGVCGMETISYHHKTFERAAGRVEGNPFRQDLEEVGRMARLDFIVNAVMTAEGGVAGLFTGDMVRAHRAGVALARRVYSLGDVPEADIGIINAYPLDADLFQSPKALSMSGAGPTVREGGAILLTTACPEGVGFHAWAGKGGKGWSGLRQMLPGELSNRSLLLYSPNLSRAQVRSMVSEEVRFFADFEEAVDALASEYPTPLVNVIPQGALAQGPSIRTA
jgi:nickel-dependent lactate racemase